MSYIRGNFYFLLAVISFLLLFLFRYCFIGFVDRDLSVSISNTPSSKGFVFLKTHKTGSSTLTSIILRKCIREKWNCFVPPSNNPGRTWDLARPDHFAYVREGQGLFGGSYPFDLWCHHAVNSNKLKNVVQNYWLDITTLRRPSNRFRSAWRWYSHMLPSNSKVGHSAKLGMSLKSFVSLVGISLNKSSSINDISTVMFRGSGDGNGNDNGKTLQSNRKNDNNKNYIESIRGRFHYRTGLDATSTELVGHSAIYGTTTYSKAVLSHVERIRIGSLFAIVLERFDESLVVLAHHLGWQIDDMLYSYSYSHAATTATTTTTTSCATPTTTTTIPKYTADDALDEREKLVLDRAQPYDLALYKAAEIALDAAIANMGPSFHKDLEELRRLLITANEKCDTFGGSDSPCNKNNKEDEWCKFLQMENKGFVKLSRTNKMSPSFPTAPKLLN